MKAHPAAAVEAWDDPGYDALKTFLIEFTGLGYYDDKPELLFERIERRMADLKCPGPSEYLGLIRNPRGADELDALIDEIAIGETYFFRYPEQFDALRATILPERIEARRHERSLRIWSAGCASGAEPYSIALLLEHEWPEIARAWPISIAGTDICERRLQRAREAQFSEWELRGLPDDLRRDCFERLGGKWRLDRRYTRRVTFEKQNLKHILTANTGAGGPRFDIILCRNVLIYFDQDLMRRILRQLRHLLAEGGWLLVGHAEPFLEIAHFLTPVSLPGTTAYRRLETAASQTLGTAPDATRPPDPDTPTGTRLTAASGTAPGPGGSLWTAHDLAAMPIAPEDEYEETPEPVVDDPLDRARRYANAADWSRAREVCEDYLRKRPLDPDAHFILALVLEHRGDPAAAVSEFRQAVYLDRKFALAHFHLGRLHALQGERRQALRSYSNAIDLLDREPAGDSVRGGEGLEVDELGSLARQQMERLVQ